jgi:hypothetical protein
MLAALVLHCGCRLSFERQLEGRPDTPGAATKLQIDSTSLRQALDRLGAPDLIVRAGTATRLYYLHKDLSRTRLSISSLAPIPGTTFRPTALTGVSGGELLVLARLDFDATDVLRELHHRRIPLAAQGGSLAVEDRIVRSFLEDRSRVNGEGNYTDDDEELEYATTLK